jgi:lipopolysaccharide cholinephosphotransferase
MDLQLIQQHYKNLFLIPQLKIVENVKWHTNMEMKQLFHNKINDKKIFEKLLIDTAIILESQNIKFWLDYGTLLGAYRDKDFIDFDDDIDITANLLDSEKIIQSLPLFIEKNIMPVRLSFWHGDNNEKERGNGIPFYQILSFSRNDHYIDIYFDLQFKSHDTILFKNHIFNIPPNVESYLEKYYGNWEVPTNLNKESKKPHAHAFKYSNLKQYFS